jgi:hypothetical protein
MRCVTCAEPIKIDDWCIRTRKGLEHSKCLARKQSGRPVRRGEPWTKAEIKRMLRLVDKIPPEERRGWPFWRKIATALGRGGCAVQTQYYITKRCANL